MPRIAMLLSSFITGGMERQALSLARSVGEHGFDPLMISLDGSGPLQEDIEEAGLPSLILNKKKSIDLALFVRLARLGKEHSIDLIHAHNWYAGFYAVGSRFISNVPVVTTLHGFAYNVIKRRQFLRMLAAKLSTYTVCVGQQVGTEAIRKYKLNGKKVKVIYNGVDCQGFAASSQGAEVRASLGIGPETTVFLFVGRISPIKDLPCLLEATARLARSRSGFRVIIAGSGESLGELQGQARQLGVSDKVSFLGERKDIPDLLSASDALVMSSLNEGISMAILEAMAAGLPVIATDVGGNSELVKDQHTGLLVGAKDAAGLAGAMQRAVDDPGRLRQMGQAGQSVCLNQFSLQQMVENYCAVYSDAIAGR
ncbi:MAG: glycosyltransferase [Desulfarculaceae bacterium]|nr:glycosyltransferase [Desulfarculaceae bacterium]MCF8074001.1 glycosyltransferase [Desulfarculaceae bacterium]MCF8102687.1 glycosyltransferase [Desulfarculaceae bacterium]MCF8116072.1 glycosyltransferase [Desulfarculaceae bacterium]